METDYMKLDEACAFVARCECEGVFIYGIERFIYDSGYIVPDLSGIADFSAIQSNQVLKSIVASKEFLSLYGDDENERFTVVH